MVLSSNQSKYHSFHCLKVGQFVFVSGQKTSQFQSGSEIDTSIAAQKPGGALQAQGGRGAKVLSRVSLERDAHWYLHASCCHHHPRPAHPRL